MPRRPTGRTRRPVARSSASAPPWSPLDLAGLEAWYRETYAAGTWFDLSGKGRHLTQATAGARPTQTARAGQAVLSCDGGDSVALAYSATISQPYTIYAVSEAPSVASTQVIYSGHSATADGMLQIRANDYRISSGTFLAGGTSSTAISASAAAYNGASSSLCVNNFATPVASGNAGSGILRGLSVGAQQAASVYLTGYVWEIIVCSGAHDAATRKLVGDYFTARYAGLTVTT